MKREYNSNLPIKCHINYSVSYMLLSNKRVRMSVGKHIRKPSNDTKVEGNGVEFASLEIARKYAYDRGYIVYDPQIYKKDEPKDE